MSFVQLCRHLLHRLHEESVDTLRSHRRGSASCAAVGRSERQVKIWAPRKRTLSIESQSQLRAHTYARLLCVVGVSLRHTPTHVCACVVVG